MTMSKVTKPQISTQGCESVFFKKTFSEVFGYLAINTFSRDLITSRISTYRNVHYGDILVKFGETLDVEKDDLPYVSTEVLDKAKLSTSFKNSYSFLYIAGVFFNLIPNSL